MKVSRSLDTRLEGRRSLTVAGEGDRSDPGGATTRRSRAARSLLHDASRSRRTARRCWSVCFSQNAAIPADTFRIARPCHHCWTLFPSPPSLPKSPGAHPEYVHPRCRTGADGTVYQKVCPPEVYELVVELMRVFGSPSAAPPMTTGTLSDIDDSADSPQGGSLGSGNGTEWERVSDEVRA